MTTEELQLKLGEAEKQINDILAALNKEVGVVDIELHGRSFGLYGDTIQYTRPTKVQQYVNLSVQLIGFRKS